MDREIMNRITAAVAVSLTTFLTLAACGTEEAETPGGISAQVECTGRDSLLATVYMTGEDVAAASQWCACAGSGMCSVDFSGLGYGDYLLGIGRPDSMYRATEGAEGFARTLGYFTETGLAQDLDEATTITLSADQPRSDVLVSMDGEPGMDDMPGMEGGPGMEDEPGMNDGSGMEDDRGSGGP